MIHSRIGRVVGIDSGFVVFVVLIAPFDMSIAVEVVGAVKMVQVEVVVARREWMWMSGSMVIPVKGDDAGGNHVSAASVDSIVYISEESACFSRVHGIIMIGLAF